MAAPAPSSADETPQVKIGFATVCKGRVDHLKQTLPKNIADNADYPNAVFVVLTYASDHETLAYLKSHTQDIATGRVAVYAYDGAKFHLSHAKNLAMRCAMAEGATLLVTQDADNYTGQHFAQFVSDAMREPGIFLVPDHLYIQSLPHGPQRPNRGFAGRLAVRAQDFIKVGGYDEVTYPVWRGEDIDLNFRLERAGYTRRFIPNHFLNTIPHGANVRFKEYPEAQQFENPDEVKTIRARTETIVNYGQIGVGTVYRNFSPTPIHLKPLPTRVFNIGIHKTGTTSLHEAMKLLGFDSLHWGTGEAPLIWYEMQGLGRSPTLERFYALSDLPIPLLYQQLDQAYPGSRFILTIRNEEDWLKSVQKLWDPRYNKTRHLWEIYPFTHHIHTILYGQKEFDGRLFLERYRRHNTEVMEYFHGRSDLLVMNMDDGSDWSALCRLLDKDVPTQMYPRANQSQLGDIHT